jgi:hypothetical protein
MPQIRSLKPNVSRDEAIAQFSAGGILGLLRNLASGPLRSVADFYIPFRLYQVEVRNRGMRDQRVFGLDAVNGSLDLYQFPQLPGASEVVCRETRNCFRVLLDETSGVELLITKVRRLVYARGFFRIRDLQISAEPVAGELYVPYWVGFRGRGRLAQFVVLDAVRRRVEGAKVRHLLQAWLLSPQGTPPLVPRG